MTDEVNAEFELLNAEYGHTESQYDMDSDFDGDKHAEPTVSEAESDSQDGLG